MITSKTVFNISGYLIQCDKLVLTVGTELPIAILKSLIAKGGVLIWEHRGSFKLLSTTILHNVVTRYETARSISASYPRIKPPKDLMLIDWNQGWYIKPEIVEVLLVPNNSGNDLSNTNPAPDTTGKD